MRWFYLSLLLVVLGLGLVVSASRPSAAQNKQLTTFELGLLAEHNSVRQKNDVPPLTWDDTLAVARMGIDNDNIILTAPVLDTSPRPAARQITSAVTPTTAPVQTPTPSTYCPTSPLTRADAAKFILLAKHGSTYTPPAATGTISDVPLSNPDAPWIEQLAKEGITSGCSSTNDAGKQYCPNSTATRGEMAVFLMRSIHGGNYTPPAATGGVFNDVGVGHPYAPWIEQLAKEGISKGTSITPPTFSPDAAFSRGEMAVFILRSIHGGNYAPPAATGIFKDVEVGHLHAPWIEQLAKEGIAFGCGK